MFSEREWCLLSETVDLQLSCQPFETDSGHCRAKWRRTGIFQFVKAALSSVVALFGTSQIAANGIAQSIGLWLLLFA